MELNNGSADRRTRLGISGRTVLVTMVVALALPFATWDRNTGSGPQSHSRQANESSRNPSSGQHG